VCTSWQYCSDSSGILLGVGQSFVYLDDLATHRSFITVGDLSAHGSVDFFLLGQHHTQFSRRHLIPYSIAREIVQELLLRGTRTSSVKWEEWHY